MLSNFFLTSFLLPGLLSIKSRSIRISSKADPLFIKAQYFATSIILNPLVARGVLILFIVVRNVSKPGCFNR